MLEVLLKFIVALVIVVPLAQLLVTDLKNEIIVNMLLGRSGVEDAYDGTANIMAGFVELAELKNQVALVTLEYSLYYPILLAIGLSMVVLTCIVMVHLQKSNPKNSLLE